QIPAPAKATLSQHQEAMVVIQKGGRVAQINQRARELFHLEAHDIPDLEALARRARPGEEFLTLCAAEGQGRFMLDGRLAEAVSYAVHSGPQPVMVVTIRFPELGG